LRKSDNCKEIDHFVGNWCCAGSLRGNANRRNWFYPWYKNFVENFTRF